jgi:hypothetical protein
MTDINQRLADVVDAEIENLKDLDVPYERKLGVLDVVYTVGADKSIREITLTTATGGPHVEIDLMSGSINAHWGSEDHYRTIDDEDARESLDILIEKYRAVFNA